MLGSLHIRPSAFQSPMLRRPRAAVAWSHMADRFKEPPAHESPSMVASWQEADRELHSFLTRAIPEALEHTGATAFDQHLVGVQSVLRHWGADEEVARSGLFHSIYGTEGYQGFKLPFTKRKEIRALIGERAERLAWIFCVVDRLSLDELVDRELNHLFEQLSSPLKSSSPRFYDCYSRTELGRFPIRFKSKIEWLDLIELTLADWLEQVEGAAERSNALYGWKVGEAWSYRQVAYHQMAELLMAHRS